MSTSKEKQPSEKSRRELMEKDDLITELEGQDQTILDLKARVAELEKDTKGLSGYVVHSPNAKFSGVTAGITFQNGMAFIPDGAGALAKVNELKEDFRYSAQHVDSWRTLPQAEEIGKSFVQFIH